MGHEHNHESGNLKTAFYINLTFTIIEIVGGVLTNSVAILSDAVHDLGDSISLLFSMMMEKVSKKEGNKNLTFGYKRYSLLGAVFSAFVLILGSTFVLYNAINRLFTVEEVHAEGMFFMAIAGIVFNGIAVMKLKKDKSINSKVVFLHLLEDVLGWGSILVVSTIMIFIDIPILDPVLSIVIAVFVLSRIIPTFTKIGRIFLQYKPDDVEIKEVVRELVKIDGIQSVHDIHLWSLDGINHILSIHIVVDEGTTIEKITELKTAAKGTIRSLGIDHATTEMELPNEECVSCN